MTNTFTEYKPSIVSDIVEFIVLLVYGSAVTLTYLHHYYFQSVFAFILALLIVPNLRIVATRSLREPVNIVQIGLFVMVIFGVLGCKWSGSF